MNIPIFNLQNANMDTLVQGSFTRMNSLLQMKKHRRSIDVHELRLRNMHDFFTRNKIRVDAPGLNNKATQIDLGKSLG
jgi:hypothetical protein